jgi:hypothetical protein
MAKRPFSTTSSSTTTIAMVNIEKGEALTRRD